MPPIQVTAGPVQLYHGTEHILFKNHMFTFIGIMLWLPIYLNLNNFPNVTLNSDDLKHRDPFR